MKGKSPPQLAKVADGQDPGTAMTIIQPPLPRGKSSHRSTSVVEAEVFSVTIGQRFDTLDLFTPDLDGEQLVVSLPHATAAILDPEAVRRHVFAAFNLVLRLPFDHLPVHQSLEEWRRLVAERIDNEELEMSRGFEEVIEI